MAGTVFVKENPLVRLFVYTQVSAQQLMQRVDSIFSNQAAVACLHMLGIVELWQLLIHTRDDLMAYGKFSRTMLNHFEEVLKGMGLRLGMFKELRFLIERSNDKSPALFELIRQTGPRNEAERAFMAKKHLDFGVAVEDIFKIPKPLTQEQIEFLGKYVKEVPDMPEAVLQELFIEADSGGYMRDLFVLALLPGFRLRDEFNEFLGKYGLSLDLPPSFEEMKKAKPKY